MSKREVSEIQYSEDMSKSKRVCPDEMKTAINKELSR